MLRAQATSQEDAGAAKSGSSRISFASGPIRRPIERVDYLTPEQFENEYVRRSRPVIMTNRMKDWPALREWTPEYFKKNHGDVVVRVSRNLPDTAVPSRHFWEDHTGKMTMAEFVDLMNSSARPCYADSCGLHYFSGEKGKVEFDSLIANADGRSLSLLWIGSKGTHSGLHFDRYNNLFGQIRGEKVVCLLAPDQSPYLYQFKDVIQKSNIDPERPDLDRYPEARNATIWEETVRAGDILFIPKLWWHALRSTEPSLSINHWFGKDASIGEVLPLVRTGGVLSWLTIARDFVWHGVVGMPFKQRLLSEEPNGVWLYNQVAAAIRKRTGRGGDNSG